MPTAIAGAATGRSCREGKPLHPSAFREIGLVWSADRPPAPAVRAFRDYAESGAVGAWSVRAGRGPIVLTA
ncbi:hypothetical protein ACIBQ0_00130 [Nocardia nova]|uniref:hypothetical protein n=1 Tax=Nocardia nova TaxID=37330 RepID=UPI0037AB67CF